jgi:DNA-binding NarL/FixJ family response regulator
LIIDSKLITRRCLTAAIQSADSSISIMAVASIEEAPALQDGVVFDAVLVSPPPNMTAADPMDRLLGPIQAVLPETAIILLARSGDQADMAAALRHGVRGYLTIETPLTVTVDLIRLVCAGWTVHPPMRVADSPPAEHEILPDPAAAGVLTVRQLQVARLLAKGMPNKSIAFDLHMSERTVKAHVRAIMQRFGAANRTQVVAKWVGSAGPPVGDQGGAGSSADRDLGHPRSGGET